MPRVINIIFGCGAVGGKFHSNVEAVGSNGSERIVQLETTLNEERATVATLLSTETMPSGETGAWSSEATCGLGNTSFAADPTSTRAQPAD